MKCQLLIVIDTHAHHRLSRVLTAQSCAVDDRLTFARVGYNEDGVEAVAGRAINEIVSHPESLAGARSSGNWPNNLAIVRLDNPVTDVEPIRINDNRAVPSDNQNQLTFIGAGDIPSEDESVNFHELAIAETLFTIGFISCRAVYRESDISLDEVSKRFRWDAL